MLLLHLLGGTTGTEHWFWVVASGILAVIGASQVGDVIRDRQRRLRPPEADR